MTLPVIHRPITVPYRFQNGSSISSNRFGFRACNRRASRKTGRYAVEGELLFTHRDEQFGDLKLVVVGQFAGDQGEVVAAVHHVLLKNETEFYTTEEVGQLVENLAAGHPAVS